MDTPPVPPAHASLQELPTAHHLRNALADTRPLGHPEFARLWYANIVTVIGAQLTVVTVPAQLWAIARDSTYVGLTGLFGLVPLIVFGLWGGAVADAFDRRRVLVVSTIGMIVCAGAFAAQALLDVDDVWLILGLFALQQSFFAMNQPARNAVIPMLVPASELPAANSLNMTVSQFGAIAGPLVGGALLPMLGAGPLYALDAVTMLATLWAVLRLPSLRPGHAIGSLGLGSIVEGFRYAWASKVLLVSFVVDLIAMVLGLPRTLYPQIADVDFGGPPSGGIAFALLSAGMAAGAVAGGVFSGWVSRVRRQGLAVLAAVAVWGLAVIGTGVSVRLAGGRAWPFLVAAVAMLAVGGAADMASSAFRQSILLSAATDEVRGRLQGVFLVVVVGGPRLADVVHGLAADRIGAAPTIIVGGAAVLVGVLACGALVPGFRSYVPAER